jgi:PAS domain S-box-containing protein
MRDTMSDTHQTTDVESWPQTGFFSGLAGMTAAPASLGHLTSDTVLIVILSFAILLLLGVLIRLRQYRIGLEQESRALTKSESHLRLMGDNLPSMALFQLLCNDDGTFRFAIMSKGYERMLGFSCEDALTDAQAVFDQVYETDIPALREVFLRGKDELAPADLDIRVLDAKGSLHWLRINAIPHLDEGTLLWDGFMQDISAVKSSERAALEENRNLQNLFHTIDDFLFVCDMDGRLLHTNPAVEDRLEYSHRELQSMSIFELYPRDTRAEAYRVVARMQSEPSLSSGLPLQAKGGAVISVETNVFQGTWKNQQAIFGVARDIALRQQNEDALRESQRMLQVIIDTIPMSVFWKDRNSVYLGCNRTFIDECGLDSRDQVVGKTPAELFDPVQAAKVIQRDQKTIGMNEARINLQESHTCPDGSMGSREISLIPLRDENGQATGVLGIWRDVSEKNRAEERLKRTLEDMERFNQLMRGRERRTLELKAEINELLKRLGQVPKYETTLENLAE